MSDEKQIIRGLIIKKKENSGETKGKEWTSNSFVVVGEDKVEVLCSTLDTGLAENLHEQDTVELEVKQSGNFTNIVNVISAKYDEEKAKAMPAEKPKSPSQQNYDDKDNYWKNKEKREIENNPKIIRQACVKAACALYSGQGQEDIDAKFIINVAKEFEKYCSIKGE